MTIDECVRALAEKMEEKPNGTNPITRKEMIRHNKTGIPILSPGGFWWWHGKTLEWQSISPLESAECSERLLLAMLADGCVLTFDKSVTHFHHPKLGGGTNADPHREAIFRIALFWQGLEEPSETR